MITLLQQIEAFRIAFINQHNLQSVTFEDMNQHDQELLSNIMNIITELQNAEREKDLDKLKDNFDTYLNKYNPDTATLIGQLLT